jgi:hypothetical protein
MEAQVEEVLRQALEAVSVRMADGRRDTGTDYCESCQAAGVHGSQRRCGCWCHRARELLADGGGGVVAAAPAVAITARGEEEGMAGAEGAGGVTSVAPLATVSGRGRVRAKAKDSPAPRPRRA